MKKISVALAIVLAGSAAGASAAHAVKPKTGTWKIKLAGAPKPPGYADGRMKVIAKKKKIIVYDFLSPDHYTKCTGPRARPVEISPGFPEKWGVGVEDAIGKKTTFAGKSVSGRRTQSVEGKFTSKRKASGTLRVRISDPEGKRTCDSGALRWTASK